MYKTTFVTFFTYITNFLDNFFRGFTNVSSLQVTSGPHNARVVAAPEVFLHKVPPPHFLHAEEDLIYCWTGMLVLSPSPPPRTQVPWYSL